ncbi:MAG: FMN-binding glutamate synthase family protein [Pseudomonadota bacterium]
MRDSLFTLAGIIDVITSMFLLAVGLGVLTIIVLYVIDITQTKHAIRRNFPVIGRLRYLFEHLGQFFRQYFYAQDREELPFNRAERSWVYRAAKGEDNTVAFGSTLELDKTGTPLFLNGAFPVLDEDAIETAAVTIGPYCREPYTTRSVFNVSAMSYGAISKPAVRALSYGAASSGVWLNTGEGGLSEYHLEGGADLVFQIGTAKYGVRTADGNLDDTLFKKVAAEPNVKMIELKLAQGAKPGKGGILPGEKVTETIAKVRGISVGEDSISPNRHPDIADNDALLDAIAHMRALGGKPVGIKTVVGDYESFEALLETINRRGEEYAPDFITIDSANGGTGAAPLSLIDNMGRPIRQTLPRVVDLLIAHELRDRIKVITSGKLITPVEVAWALCAGADFVTSARGYMMSLGCIQALQCNKNTCPTGITTHDKKLQRGLVPEDKAKRVARYANNMHKELAIIAHACGVTEPRQLNRSHCALVQEDGVAVSLRNLYAGGLEASLQHHATGVYRRPS